MAKKRIVMALGHNALGTNLPEQKEAVTETAKVIADFIQAGWQVALTHSNTPQVGMIHTAMNEFGKQHDGYTSAPMSVCSAMSQGYIGYDLQNGIRAELVKRGIYKPVATILTQMMVDPYDDSFYTPMKPVGRFMTAGEAKEEEEKGNYVEEIPGKGFRRVIASPKPVSIVEIDVIKAVMDADQIVIACGGGLPTRAEAIAALKASGVVFWLSREPAVIYDTVSMARRPLGQGGKEAFLERFRQREPIYRRWADYIIEGHTLAAEAAGRIAALYERECQA